MTDKERYQRTFSRLHASEKSFVEVKKMKNVKILPVRRFVAVCAAALMIAAMATVAYAADVGGIQRTIRYWLHGEPGTALLTMKEPGNYVVTYEDENGEEVTMGGGGVAMDGFGRERPLTEDEIIESLNRPTVEYLEDGTVWVYYKDQSMEITDKFEDGIANIQIPDGDETLYMSVRYQDGYTISNDETEFSSSKMTAVFPKG